MENITDRIVFLKKQRNEVEQDFLSSQYG